MKRHIGIILSLAMMLVVAASAKAQSSDSQKNEEQPVVIKAVAPNSYPPIAAAAKAEGKVIVEVTVNAKGKVKAARAIEGAALLQQLSVKTAKQWQFAPVSDDSKERTARLTFVFRLLSDKEKELQATSFKPPYEIEYAVVLELKNVVNY